MTNERRFAILAGAARWKRMGKGDASAWWTDIGNKRVLMIFRAHPAGLRDQQLNLRSAKPASQPSR